MNRNIFSAVVLLSFAATTSFAQSNPFTGSEKPVTKTYSNTGFTKIKLLDVDGAVEIETGKPFSIAVEMKEKYFIIFDVIQKSEELTLKFNYTKDNNKYITNPQIKVKITCPSLVDLFKQGNGTIALFLKSESDFSFVNDGNGAAVVKGTAQKVRLQCTGNGGINAQELLVSNAFVEINGNGGVSINASETLSVHRTGNGKLVQKGKAAPENK